tara:strand:+ start:1972 stop:3102 length:1131 start_codon:yes stop_codon:yes gene_type:complete
MSTGTPIRLVREDGKLISLNATEIALTTERKFGPMALPGYGSQRVAIDLNINKAEIRIDGFFTDDTVATGGAFAFARINFLHVFDGSQGTYFAVEDNLNKMFTTTATTMLFKSTDGTLDAILLYEVSGSTATAYNSSNTRVDINPSTATATQIATAVKDYINAQMSARYGASTYDIDSTSIGANAGVLITNVVMGNGGNNKSTPTIQGNPDKGFLIPRIDPFNGGSTAVQQSAGDKAQDLYSIANNSSKSLISEASFEGYYLRDILGEKVSNFLDVNKGGQSDYIVGIQIPFNSKITAGGNEYVAKNFFMPTGKGHLNKNPDKKNSFVAKSAGTTFSEKNEFSGIQGGLKSLDIIYNAGEAIYNFTMVFLPADTVF